MELESLKHSVVLVGSFNPPIFQPIWFKTMELLSDEDVETATINAISTDVCDFTLSWVHIQVLQGRFLLSSLDESRFEMVRDLAINTFQVLGHTPLVKLGINIEVFFAAKNQAELDKLGYQLVPSSFWDKKLNKPGMVRVQVREKQRADGQLGFVDVQVNPANPTEERPFGVHILVNDHYDIEDTDEVVNSEKILAILKQNWERSVAHSKSIIDDIQKAS